MGYAISRFFDWMTYEPFIGLMMIIGAVVLFIGSYRRDGNFQPATFWQWFSRILEAFSVAVIFLGLLWAFRAILNDNSAKFSNSHGRVSEANYSSLQTIWGSPHTQLEIGVNHFVIEEKEEVQQEVLDDYGHVRNKVVTVKEEVAVPQNSIYGVDGTARMQLNKRKKGSAFYSGYELDFSITYLVKNFSEDSTKTYFNFPLADQVMYDGLKVLENGRDISNDLLVDYSSIYWNRMMAPGDSMKIDISYHSRGVDYFYYQVQEPREIKNFHFRLEVDALPVEKVNYPENCLTPQKIEATADGKGTVLEWQLDDAITTSGMGIDLEKPVQPGAKVSLVLNNSPYALMLLIVSICLSMMVLGHKVNFLEISLLSAVYCLLFITMASLSDFALGFWGSLVLGNLLTLGLTWLLYRKYESVFLKRAILGLVVFFTLIYPLSGLLPELSDNFNGWVTIALIVYIFFISLYARTRKQSS